MNKGLRNVPALQNTREQGCHDMLVLISPAKTLDFETPSQTERFSQPDFLPQTQELVRWLRELAPHQISALMGISDKLGQLNYDRYVQWHTPFDPSNAKQAVLAFKGDVYTGLAVEGFSQEDLDFAQDHLRILSGLYGLLRPLDLIQPYRLEMGTKLTGTKLRTAIGKNLYGFWGQRLTDAINEQLRRRGCNALINLASQEYFRAVDAKKLAAPLITPVFKDWKNGQYKVISFYAKKARGMMASFLIRNRLKRLNDLHHFKEGGYGFAADLSSDRDWVFTRRG